MSIEVNSRDDDGFDHRNRLRQSVAMQEVYRRSPKTGTVLLPKITDSRRNQFKTVLINKI